MSSRRIVVVSAVTACLLAGCYEGGADAPESRVVTAADLERLAPGQVLELDLAAGPVRFELSDGPIDFTRVAVRDGERRAAVVQDLLIRNGARWGVETAGAGADFAFTLDADMLAPQTGAQAAVGPILWSQSQALSRLPRVDLVEPDAHGVPQFLVGDLGVLPAGEPRTAAREFLAGVAPVYRLSDDADLEPVRSRTDALGTVHVKFQQYLHDLPVVGGELTVHADAATGTVRAVTGRFVPGEDLPLAPAVDGDAAIDGVAAGLASEYVSLDVPDLVYVVAHDAPRLAWKAEVEYADADGPQRDIVFADALTGELVARHPQVHYARNRKVYTAKNGQSLPGTLLMSEGGSSADVVAKAAYDYAGVTYDFYSSSFARDSFNAAGATIHSTVHYGKNYVNAFWDGQQMVYGDGDGQWAGPFAQDQDVVVHELTHAVTQYEAGLVYQNESGALNEAMSDIMAAAADAKKNGVTTKTWWLAEAIWTPNTAGDAMRYMNDPTKDGQSYDYYPERYMGGDDNGGVHLNSGIANLAFYLVSQGGKHPRGKMPDVQVQGIGADKAAQVFYRALANYMGSNASFQDARNATAQAAKDLYGDAAATSVHNAWTAVGVPGAPNGGGGGGGGGGGQTCSGTPYKGTLSGSGAKQTQPGGTYYYSAASGTHSGCLVGPNATDYDLYLYKWNGSSWVSVAKSEGETSSESINYSGGAGYYTWQVVSYAGAGEYTLTLKAPA
jgi:vibriolysin